MIRVYSHGVGAVAAALLVWAIACQGCSCEESEPPVKEVVVQPERERAEEPQPAAKAPKREPGVGDSILRAPADYLGTVIITAPRHARKTVDTALIQNEVRQFYAIEERYPHSLKELEEWRGEPLPETPKGYTYSYDSSAGKVDVVPVR